VTSALCLSPPAAGDEPGVSSPPPRAPVSPPPHPSPAGSTPTDAATRLSERLAASLRGCRTCRWGVLVKEQSTGRVLFSRNAELPFNPASNIKVVTTAAALSALGRDFRFATRLRGRREGERIVGGLYFEGSGDPTLSSAVLADMAASLHQAGVRELDGPLYLDTYAFKDRGDPPGFSRFRSSHPFRAGVDALSLNRNVIRITITPGERVGELATVTVSPASRYLQTRALVRTGRRTRLYPFTSSSLQGTSVRVTGRIRAGAEPRDFWRRIFHPAMYASHTLLAQLAQQGIRVPAKPVVRRKAAPLDTPVLVEHRSDPAARILRGGNKESCNMMAELMLLAAGAKQFEPPASFEKGRRVVEQYVRSLGLRPGAVRVQNASGLAWATSIRPADLVRVLEVLQADRTIGAEVIASLPVAGRDGTLRRRFEGSTAAGHIIAKTGTLSGISALSGFAEHNGRRLIFSFLTSRVRRMRPVRRLHVTMAEHLVDYLRAVAPASRPASTPASQPTKKTPVLPPWMTSPTSK